MIFFAVSWKIEIAKNINKLHNLYHFTTSKITLSLWNISALKILSATNKLTIKSSNVITFINYHFTSPFYTRHKPRSSETILQTPPNQNSWTKTWKERRGRTRRDGRVVTTPATRINSNARESGHADLHQPVSNRMEWNGKSRVKEKRPEWTSIGARIKRVLLDNLSKYPWIQMKGTWAWYRLNAISIEATAVPKLQSGPTSPPPPPPSVLSTR